MKENRFNYCPECGSRNIQTLKNGRKWLCPDCGFDLYNNVASAVGLLILNEDGEKIQPDANVSFRECEEEIGVRPVSVKYLCAFPNDYEYKTIQYKTCDMFFTAELPAEYELKPQAGEVDCFVWKKIESAGDVDECPLAFESTRKTLLKWLEEKCQKIK